MTISLFESDGTLTFIGAIPKLASQTMDARHKEMYHEPQNAGPTQKGTNGSHCICLTSLEIPTLTLEFQGCYNRFRYGTISSL